MLTLTQRPLKRPQPRHITGGDYAQVAVHINKKMAVGIDAHRWAQKIRPIRQGHAYVPGQRATQLSITTGEATSLRVTIGLRPRLELDRQAAQHFGGKRGAVNGTRNALYARRLCEAVSGRLAHIDPDADDGPHWRRDSLDQDPSEFGVGLADNHVVGPLQIS